MSYDKLVTVIDATAAPINKISLAAGMSYGKSDTNLRRVERCFEHRHMSVFEQAYVTFKVTNISRACSHQLVRHRLASFVQKSQRYTKLDPNSDWYVTPPTMEGSPIYDDAMNTYMENYQDALAEGIPAEDARYLLPEAAKTELIVTMNVRELFHFMDLRCDTHAQWEIRNLAHAMCDAAGDIDDEWTQLIALWENSRGVLEP